MAFISVTYTFSNGTIADAGQVNQCFTDIINGTSDGTKSFNISALTCAGTLTANGNVVLGASSSNTLTFNGSIGSTVPVSTNSTYDIGAATTGLRSVYIGGTSTFTTRILGAATVSYTYTLPTTAGTVGQFQATDGTGVQSYRYVNKPTAVQTGTYAATNDESVILVDPNSIASFTVTLPTAVGVNGKTYTIKQTSSGTNVVTIATTSSQTIDGLASGVFKIGQQFDSMTVMSDNTNWRVLGSYPLVQSRYSQTTGQSINSASATIINFDTLILDTITSVTTGASWKFTAPYAGRYALRARLQFGAYAGNITESMRMDLYKNGSYFCNLGWSYAQTTSSMPKDVWGTDVLTLAATDYVQIELTQNHGSAVTLSTAPDLNYIEIIRLN